MAELMAIARRATLSPITLSPIGLSVARRVMGGVAGHLSVLVELAARTRRVLSSDVRLGAAAAWAPRAAGGGGGGGGIRVLAVMVALQLAM
eukprot:COSAG04_NODE_27443_length_283_cov_0.603261_1_plen_90_part_10